MTLVQLNNSSIEQLKTELFKCCGSTKWSSALASCFPFSSFEKLIIQSDKIWNTCSEQDFLEAFTHHPKIGDVEGLRKKFATTATWASNEQSGTTQATQQVLEALAKGNEEYEKKFGFIFIVCATGKSASEMLQLLQQRLPNNRSTELHIAAAEQNKITHLRLQKLISQ